MAAAALHLFPVSSRMLRLAFAAAVAATWLGVLLLLGPRRVPRLAWLALPVALSVPLLLPARAIDRAELRRDYVRRLGSYEGTRYHWGGENALGIDCSGLPRRALREALAAYGLRHADGGALRRALSMWWHDASAQALGRGHRDLTVPLAPAGTIRAMPYDGLEPGDLAVTDDGRHVLAYAGGDRWIQADPGLGAVATLDGRTDDNGWFQRAVTTHRWRVLQE